MFADGPTSRPPPEQVRVQGLWGTGFARGKAASEGQHQGISLDPSSVLVTPARAWIRLARAPGYSLAGAAEADFQSPRLSLEWRQAQLTGHCKGAFRGVHWAIVWGAGQASSKSRMARAPGPLTEAPRCHPRSSRATTGTHFCCLSGFRAPMLSLCLLSVARPGLGERPFGGPPRCGTGSATQVQAVP